VTKQCNFIEDAAYLCTEICMSVELLFKTCNLSIILNRFYDILRTIYECYNCSAPVKSVKLFKRRSNALAVWRNNFNLQHLLFLPFGPSFASPAFSSPAFLTVLHFLVLHFQSPPVSHIPWARRTRKACRIGAHPEMTFET